MPAVRHHLIEPRGLCRVDAAFYVGIGTTLFDRMVADGRMPQPRAVEGRTLWDRRELDAAFDVLPIRDAGASDIDVMLGLTS
jgi:predicted DNA-binding transcriptional regulator AlpA